MMATPMEAVAATSLPLSHCWQQHSLPPIMPPSAAPDGQAAAGGAVATGQSGGEWGFGDAWMDNYFKGGTVETEARITSFETAAASLLGTAGTGAGPGAGAPSYPDDLLLASPDFPVSLQPYLSNEPGMAGTVPTAPTTRTLSLQPDSLTFPEAGSQGGLLCQRPLYSAKEKERHQEPRCTLPDRKSQAHASAWKVDSEAKRLILGSFMGSNSSGLPVGPTVGRFSILDGNVLGSNGSTGAALDGVSSSPESRSGPPFGAVPTTSAGAMNVSCQLPSGPVTHVLRGRGVAANTVLSDSSGDVLASVLDGMATLPNAVMAGHAAAGTSAATPVPVLPVAADAIETAAGDAAGNAVGNAAGNAARLARSSAASDGSLGARRPSTGRRSDKERLRRHRVSAGLKRLEKAIPAAWLRRKYPVNLTARTDIASLLNAAVTFIEELEVHKAKLFQIHVQHMAFLNRTDSHACS